MGGGGIYAIRHGGSGKLYIGSAVSFRTRWNGHRHRLNTNKHHSAKLQNAWNKHGEAAFDFVVLEFVEDRDNLIEREQHWLDTLRPTVRGYNICPVAGNTAGVRASEETKSKMRAARSNVSAETRAKRSASLKGRVHSPETIAKMRAAAKGRVISPEQRLKMSVAQKARTPESYDKARATRAGYVPSEETRSKVSATLMGIKRSPKTKARIGAASKGRVHSEESKAKRLASWRAGRTAKSG